MPIDHPVIRGEERRWVRSSVRALPLPSTGGSRRVIGHAAVFGQLSHDLGGFREMVAPGAFAESLKDHDCHALFNHDRNYVLGRASAGTARFREDDQGLVFDVDMPDCQWARDLMVSIERGDIDQASFGFETLAADWAIADDGSIVRTLRKVRLYDAGPVTLAAYPQTDASIRSASGAEMRSLIEARSRLALRSPRTGDRDLILAEIQALTELVREPWEVDMATRARRLEELRRGLEV